MADVAEVYCVTEARGQHLTEQEVAAYADGAATAEARARIADHLSECSDCRAEVVDTSRIARSLPGVRATRRWIWAPIAAAAVLVFVLVSPDTLREPRTEHREAPVTTTVLPRAVTPVGIVDSLSALVWTSVPHADRYRVRIFGGNTSVLWDREVTDTTIGLPATLGLQPDRAYFWLVEAQIGFGRGATSELVEFSIRRPARP